MNEKLRCELFPADPRPALSDQQQRRPPVGVELVLEVTDVQAERNHVAAGWTAVEELVERPWGLSDFRLLDPDGYYWRITSTAQ